MIEEALRIFTPKTIQRTIDWAREYGWNEDGKPYNDFLYPHLSAPGGPFDAFDSEQFFDIWLQWGSRLGKTFGGQIVMMKRADCDPCPMMFASSDENLAVGVVERTYAMLNHCQPLRDLLPPPNRRKQSRISLRYCRVFVAWARSVSSLADKSVRFGHASEIDKWEHQSTSKEADPLRLFDDRSKDFPTFKRWKESTPAIRGKSRIEGGRLQSCNASFYVPCPQCHRYQVLKMGQMKWEKNAAGRSDKTTAHATARYQCEHCNELLGDEHRGPMMRGGVWVPEGCRVNEDGAREVLTYWRQPGRDLWKGWKESPWIEGTPLRDGRDYGCQLSSLHALARTWGDIAAEFVGCKDKPQDLRNFVNQWLAETWEEVHRKATWESVGLRIIAENQPRGVVPSWASLVTIGVDKQGDTRYPWVVDAWGPGHRSATIAYGECESLEEVGQKVISHAWPHADGGQPLRAGTTLVDSGHRPRGVYEFVIQCQRQGLNVLACKGSSTELNADWRRSELGKDTSLPGMELFMVDTIRTQLWIDHALHDLKREDINGTSLYTESLQHHQDFLEQIINDAAIESLDSSNNAREKWQRINENTPNDYRDCRRYAYVAMLKHTRGAPILARRQAIAPRPIEPQEPSRIRSLKIRGR